MAGKHLIGLSARGAARGHNHPHDPSDIIEWIVMVAGAAMALTLVFALAFMAGRP